jgi:hypothetical protein
VLTHPERWRANSKLAFYYKVLTRSDTGGLCLLEYASAMEFYATSRSGTVILVPLFRQVAQPPGGSAYGVPLQFAVDMATGGQRGIAYEHSHIAAGYISALQALAHHASEHDWRQCRQRCECCATDDRKQLPRRKRSRRGKTLSQVQCRC